MHALSHSAFPHINLRGSQFTLVPPLQVALLCVMAQVGSFVPASSATLGLVDAVYTRWGRAVTGGISGVCRKNV